MDKYLLEILKLVNTIIIPGLGALTITNAEKGEIMFMSYLKHDDGKLTSYISEKEGLDENDAKNLVAKYVREIQIELDKGETYDMYQFGSFYKNDGEVDFKSWSQMNDTSTEEKEEAKPLPVVEDTEEKIEENILIPTPEKTEEPEVKEEIIAETPKKTPAPRKVAEKKVTLAAKPAIKKEPLKDNLYVAPGTENKELNILEKEEQAATAAKLETLRLEQENKKKKKRGVGFYILLAFIAVLIGGGTFFGLNYDQYKQHIPFLADNKTEAPEEVDHLQEMEEILNGEETETEEIIDNESDLEETTDGIQISEEEIEEPETIETPVKQITTPGSDLPFHIIAGAFSSESNANRLGDKLRNEGYSVKVGPGRGMTLVSVKSFQTRAEAQAGLSDLKDVAPNGWVYEWN